MTRAGMTRTEIIRRLLANGGQEWYRVMMKANHPDLFPPEQRAAQTKKAQEINRVYQEMQELKARKNGRNI